MYNKRLWAFILILGLGVSIMGCGMISKNQGNEDKIVIATVNGEKITKGEFTALYDQIKQNYYITEDIENDPEQKDTIDEVKTGVLDQLISEKLIIQNAKDAGFILTDDILEEARVEFENIISDVARQMEEMDGQMQDGQEEDDSDESKDYINEARTYIADELNAIGQTQEEYIEFMAEQMVVDRYMEELVKDVNADEEEIKAYYEERLKSQKENIATIAYEDVELYLPEEARVKHVLIKLPDEEIDEYNNMVAEGKEGEAKEYLHEKLKGIEPKAIEALDKANNGEAFEKLIEEYGQDPGMEGNDAGYMVRQDGSFMPEFEEMAFKLKEGEISDLVATSFGYHIIKLYEKNAEKIYTLEERHSEVKEAVDQQKKADAWMVMLDEWMKGAKIKRYEKRL